MKNAVILCITSVIIRLVGISFNAYVIKKIGNTGMGMFQLVMSVYMLFVSLGGAGISMATMRIVAEELSDNNPSGILKAVRKTLLFSAVTGLASCCLMYFSADFIANAWLDDPNTAAGIRVLAFSVPFIALSSVIKGYFTAVRRSPKVSFADAVEQLAYMSLAVILLTYVAPDGAQNMFIALTAADTLAEMFSFLLLAGMFLGDRRRYMPVKAKPRRGSLQQQSHPISMSRVQDTRRVHISTKRILHINVPVAINMFLRSGISSLNKLLVPYSLQKYGLSKDAALGDYGVVHGMVFPILQIPELILTSFASLLVPEFADFYQKKDTRSIKRAMDLIFRYTFLFSIGIVGIFSYYARDICNMAYGDASAGVYLALLAPYAMLLYLDRVVDNTLTGLHQQVNSMLYNIIESMLSTVLIIVFVPAFGMLGYIMVLFIGKAINMWMSFARLVRVTNYPIPFFQWVIQPALCILASISITMLLRSMFGGTAWAAWLLVTVVAYLLLLGLCGLLKPAKIVNGFIHRRA